jgi:small-conductance mechanosensitive channel
VVCRVANYTDQWRIGEELRMAVKKRFEAEGIEIPYPQYVIYSKNNS